MAGRSIADWRTDLSRIRHNRCASDAIVSRSYRWPFNDQRRRTESSVFGGVDVRHNNCCRIRHWRLDAWHDGRLQNAGRNEIGDGNAWRWLVSHRRCGLRWVMVGVMLLLRLIVGTSTMHGQARGNIVFGDVDRWWWHCSRWIDRCRLGEWITWTIRWTQHHRTWLDDWPHWWLGRMCSCRRGCIRSWWCSCCRMSSWSRASFGSSGNSRPVIVVVVVIVLGR